MCFNEVKRPTYTFCARTCLFAANGVIQPNIQPQPVPATFTAVSRDMAYMPNSVQFQGDIPVVATPPSFGTAQTNRQVAMDNARNTLHDEIQEEAAAVRANHLTTRSKSICRPL
jgi:hypothetical protein